MANLSFDTPRAMIIWKPVLLLLLALLFNVQATLEIDVSAGGIIPDGSSLLVSFHVPAGLDPHGVSIRELRLRLALQHAQLSDLIVELFPANSPANGQAPLQPHVLFARLNVTSSSDDESSQWLANTLLEDGASRAMTQASPPFIGAFRPQQSFATFKGQVRQSGLWYLRLTDTVVNGRAGQLFKRGDSTPFSRQFSGSDAANTGTALLFLGEDDAMTATNLFAFRHPLPAILVGVVLVLYIATAIIISKTRPEPISEPKKVYYSYILAGDTYPGTTEIVPLRERYEVNLRQNHLWLSCFTADPRSTFSRLERLTCVVVYVLIAMCLNGAFYAAHVTGLHYFTVGFFASLLAYPPVLLLSLLFSIRIHSTSTLHAKMAVGYVIAALMALVSIAALWLCAVKFHYLTDAYTSHDEWTVSAQWFYSALFSVLFDIVALEPIVIFLNAYVLQYCCGCFYCMQVRQAHMIQARRLRNLEMEMKSIKMEEKEDTDEQLQQGLNHPTPLTDTDRRPKSAANAPNPDADVWHRELMAAQARERELQAELELQRDRLVSPRTATKGDFVPSLTDHKRLLLPLFPSANPQSSSASSTLPPLPRIGHPSLSEQIEALNQTLASTPRHMFRPSLQMNFSRPSSSSTHHAQRSHKINPSPIRTGLPAQTHDLQQLQADQSHHETSVPLDMLRRATSLSQQLNDATSPSSLSSPASPSSNFDYIRTPQIVRHGALPPLPFSPPPYVPDSDLPLPSVVNNANAKSGSPTKPPVPKSP